MALDIKNSRGFQDGSSDTDSSMTSALEGRRSWRKWLCEKSHAIESDHAQTRERSENCMSVVDPSLQGHSRFLESGRT